MARAEQSGVRTDPFNTSGEREWAEIMRLHEVHKNHGSLGTFYEMYPHLALRRDSPERGR